nr:hypothetical protein [Kofleriaceae bacterium]
MKKCTSCSKDLPDAALHCVFCGAKQASAPAQAPGLAKTVMGYSAQEMIQQIRQQGIPAGTPGAPAVQQSTQPMPPSASFGSPPTAPPPMGASQGPFGAPPTAPPPMGMPQGPFGAPPPTAPPPMNPSLAATIAPSQLSPAMAAQLQQINAGANTGNPQLSPGLAATIAPQQMSPFAQPSPHAPPQYAPPPGNPGAVLGTGAAPAMIGPIGGAVHDHGSGPIGPIGHGPGPSSGGAVLGGGGVLTGSQPIVGLPSDPPANKIVARPAPAPAAATRAMGGDADALSGPVKAMMLVAGILLVVFFVAPLALDPLSFQFEAFKNIGDASVKGMIGMLFVPVVGVLAIVLALVVSNTVVRGAIAAVLGLGSIAFVLEEAGAFDHIQWQMFALLFGAVLTIAGLAIRSRFYGSMAARILATLGALAAIAVFVVPEGDKMMIGEVFDGLTSGNTVALVGSVVALLSLLASVLGLLAWLPSSGSAGAGAIAIMMLLAMLGGAGVGTEGFVVHFADSLFGSDGAAIGDQISALVKQPAFGLLGWAPITAFVALSGWGLGGLVGRPA